MAPNDLAVPPGRSRAVPRDVKEAVEHMRADVARRITTAELARVCGVPERTLHRHFVAFVGSPPLAHLRRMRLAAAREALLDPGGGASVTEVAARYGFAHPGRFASDYRRSFDEPPSATLARGRAAAAEREGAAATAPRGAPVTSEEEGRWPGPSLWRRPPPLAVLPFRTEPGRLEERVLAEALVEQLAAALSRAYAVSVRAAGAAAPGGPGRAARDLGARYCLTGRVARSPEGRVRVVARLLDLAAGGVHLWDDAFDGTTGDPFGLLDRVVAGAARTVPASVLAAEVERPRRKPARDLGAGDLVLRALPLALAADPASARRALGPLEEAMALDPDDPAPGDRWGRSRPRDSAPRGRGGGRHAGPVEPPRRRAEGHRPAAPVRFSNTHGEHIPDRDSGPSIGHSIVPRKYQHGSGVEPTGDPQPGAGASEGATVLSQDEGSGGVETDPKTSAPDLTPNDGARGERHARDHRPRQDRPSTRVTPGRSRGGAAAAGVPGYPAAAVPRPGP
jgi:TolB-like protein/AraC-like DNA-binding protein